MLPAALMTANFKTEDARAFGDAHESDQPSGE